MRPCQRQLPVRACAQRPSAAVSKQQPPLPPPPAGGAAARGGAVAAGVVDVVDSGAGNVGGGRHQGAPEDCRGVGADGKQRQTRWARPVGGCATRTVRPAVSSPAQRAAGRGDVGLVQPACTGSSAMADQRAPVGGSKRGLATKTGSGRGCGVAAARVSPTSPRPGESVFLRRQRRCVGDSSRSSDWRVRGGRPPPRLLFAASGGPVRTRIPLCRFIRSRGRVCVRAGVGRTGGAAKTSGHGGDEPWVEAGPPTNAASVPLLPSAS